MDHVQVNVTSEREHFLEDCSEERKSGEVLKANDAHYSTVM